MKKINIFFLGLLVLNVASSQQFEANWTSLNKRKIPSWFQQDKFGIFIHWGVYAVPAYAPVIPNSGNSYSEWYWYRLNEKQKDFISFHDKSYDPTFYIPNLNPSLRQKCSAPSNGRMSSKNQARGMLY